MNETLVYDAARDASAGLISTIATLCIIGGFALMAVPMVLMMRRQREKRRRGAIGLGVLAGLAVAVVFGFRTLDRMTSATSSTQSIEGVIGAVSPTLLTVGGLKVMYSCADTSHCPGIAVGDRARVEYVDDSGPETDALAVRVWRRSATR